MKNHPIAGITGIAGALLLLVLGMAQAVAGETTAKRFATVHKITGTVQAANGSATHKRDLKAGDTVYVGEHIRASANGEAVLRTDDAGVIAVRPNAAFSMEQFSAEGDTKDSLSLRIFAGALRLITGWTARFNKDNHRIRTPSGTVGIRGTDHEPYVLGPELSVELQQPEGTYDKVNTGETVLRANGAEVAVTPGRVGFAPIKPPGRTRALMTALLPTLLDTMPGFYVAGSFDAELEELARTSMGEALQSGRLARADAQAAAQAGAAGVAPAPGSGTPESAPAGSSQTGTATATKPDPAGCPVSTIARTWLADLDGAIVQRDANLFMAQFDADATISATVRDGQGKATTLAFTRMELVKSTFASMAQLTEFSSRRPVVRAAVAKGSTAAQCTRIEVESVVIESGVRNGGSYRIESLETFTLAKRAGAWVAVRAQARQQ